MPICWFSSDLGNLAHATVRGLPAETVGPAEIPQAGEVLPQHTAPGLNFGKEVGLAATVAMPQSFVSLLSVCACIYTVYVCVCVYINIYIHGRDFHVCIYFLSLMEALS